MIDVMGMMLVTVSHDENPQVEPAQAESMGEQ